jgi:hypothetical protein
LKLSNANRRLLSVAVLFMLLSVSSTRPANAQSDANQFKGAPEQVQYSSEELESLRSKLLELVDAVNDFSQSLKPGDAQAASSIARARTQIEQYSAKELNSLRASLDPSKMNGELAGAREVLNDFKPSLQESQARNFKSSVGLKGMMQINSAGFPAVEGPDAVCSALIGSGRPSSDLVIAADAVYMAAKIVDVALNRACNQVAVAVILGEGGGGNTSLVCVASDAVLLAAETVRDKVQSCSDDFDKRLIDASVARLAHVHTDIENSVANDNANTTTITGALTTASNNIVNNDNTNKNTIVANDNNNKNTILTAISNSQGAIVDNANGNTTTLTTAISTTQTAIINNDNSNKNTIVANDNANALMLSNLLLRLQIEADLAAADNATPVALFVTPDTSCGSSAPLNQCGLLGLVRQIVVQTISNLAGSNASQANSFLAKGDQYRNAGNYAAAYQQYRAAYKTATK